MKSNIEWTKPKPPTKGVSHYDHTICITPLGRLIIEWKSWKERPSYDIEIEGQWIGCEYNLEEAKGVAIKYIKDKSEELINFLKL